MSNNLQASAIVIRDQLLTAEDLSDKAAAAQARLIATLIEQRQLVGRPIHVGAREIDRGYQALGRTLGSLRAMIGMHKGLSTVAAGEGVQAWYGADETVPNEPGAHLKSVA